MAAEEPISAEPLRQSGGEHFRRVTKAAVEEPIAVEPLDCDSCGTK